ncbi:MAG: proton-coupled thiamine transporter YuaJ, partial [Lachnospiraceae bacterium]|nr:proton-coupled thiamine transporter YuaJ [Lachnospiraceae bacterium]
MSFIHLVEDGSYYELTKSGYIALTVLLIAAIAIAAIIVSLKQNKENKVQLNARTLAFVGISIALAFVTSYIKFELPMGGSVTLFSMFF